MVSRLLAWWRRPRPVCRSCRMEARRETTAVLSAAICPEDCTEPHWHALRLDTEGNVVRVVIGVPSARVTVVTRGGARVTGATPSGFPSRPDGRGEREPEAPFRWQPPGLGLRARQARRLSAKVGP